MKRPQRRSPVLKIPSLAELLTGDINFKLVPGGKPPVRKHCGLDAAYDCHIRGVASMGAKKKSNQRTLLCDLTVKSYKCVLRQNHEWTQNLHRDAEGIYWILRPGESVSLALGFNIQIPFGLAGFMCERGSNIVKGSKKLHLVVLNKNPIDHGFIGEPWLELRNDGKDIFKIRRNMQLGQLLIMPVWRGKLKLVKRLKSSLRGTGSNGNTDKH